jgi:hypothetical protein
MPVCLNGALLRELIEACGGMDAFLDRWHTSNPDGTDHLNKATVHRWINGQLPKNGEKLLRLSAVLNIDPFALLSPGKAGAREAADALLEIVQSGRSVPASLQFVRPFFGRQQHWPPGIICADGRTRLWHVCEFEHDPSLRANCYATIELGPSGPEIEFAPRVLHFAFRQPRTFGARWLQYGSV